MAFVAIPNAWRVSLIFKSSITGYIMVNTIGVLDPAAHTIERAGVIGGVVKDWWNTNMKALSHSRIALTQVYVLDQAEETGVSLEYVTGLPISGTASGDVAPDNAAPIVTFRSEGRGRRTRGRNFIVGAPNTVYNGGDGTSLDADAATAYHTAYTALKTAIDAQDAQHAVLSRVDAAGHEIVSYDVRSYLGTQRRRVKYP